MKVFRLASGLSKICCLLGHLKLKEPYCIKDHKNDHKFDNLSIPQTVHGSWFIWVNLGSASDQRRCSSLAASGSADDFPPNVVCCSGCMVS